MKRIGILLLFISVIHSSFSQGGHSISFRIEGLEEDSVLLGYHFGEKRLRLDTLIRRNGQFVIQGQDSLQSGMYFLYTPRFYYEFIIHDQKFTLDLKVNQSIESVKVTGSPENQLFKDFQLRVGHNQRVIKRLQDSIKNVNEKDSIFIQERITAIGLESAAYRLEMMNKHPDEWFSRIMKMMSGIQPPAYEGLTPKDRQLAQAQFIRDHYMDGFDNPKDYMRTPAFLRYVDDYFDKVVFQQPDSINVALDDFLNRCKDQPTLQYWLTEFLKKYQSSKIMGQDAVYIHLIEEYCLKGRTPWYSEETMKELKEEVLFIKPGLIGQDAPRFAAVDTVGNRFDLRSLSYDFYVLMFYDPDCGHCKKQVPILNGLHDDVKDMGGEIVGICTTTIVSEWKEFIEKYNLKWQHAADPGGRSRFRVDYNVRTTPQLFVLDRNFKIVGKQMDIGTQLMGFLDHHFGKK